MADCMLQEVKRSDSSRSSLNSRGFLEATSARLLPEESRQPSSSSTMPGPQLAVRSRERFTLVVMGRSAVGKTAITLRYTRNRFVQEYDPTIEDLELKQTTVGGVVVSLEILDTAGQETYSALRRGWMQHGAGFLFVFSLVDRQTFDELGAFYDELMDLYNNDPPPSVLVANKADLDSSEWVVREDEIRRLQADWTNCIEVVYTSAKTSRNVDDAFQALCVAIRARRRRASTDSAVRIPPETLQINDEFSCSRCRVLQCVRGCTIL